MTKIAKPVVVGVDGSDAALNAVMWAIDEATSRGVPLRSVHATYIEDDSASGDEDFSLDVQSALESLRTATDAVRATNKPVAIETQILWGSPAPALLDESHEASLICVGSVGIGPIAREFLGSTAATLAEKASCPVAIIRSPHHKHEAGANWIVVAVEDRADSESVIAYAMEEAALRNAAVLAVGVEQNEYRKASYDALDRRVAKLKQRYPSSQIFPVVTGDDITGYLADNSDEVVQQNLFRRGVLLSLLVCTPAHLCQRAESIPEHTGLPVRRWGV